MTARAFNWIRTVAAERGFLHSGGRTSKRTLRRRGDKVRFEEVTAVLRPKVVPLPFMQSVPRRVVSEVRC
jgi:hypothetical protein